MWELPEEIKVETLNIYVLFGKVIDLWLRMEIPEI